MSLVLQALSKAEKLSKKDKYIPSAEQEKIGEITTSFQRKLFLIVIVNLVILSIILCSFIVIYFLKNDKKTPDVSLLNESDKVIMQNKDIKENIIESKKIEGSIPVEVKNVDDLSRNYILKKNYISFKNGPEIAINGVIIDEQGAFAMIDGDMYKAGDNIDGAILKKVTIGKVFIEYEGKDYEVRT